jgi:hypothetical protein
LDSRLHQLYLESDGMGLITGFDISGSGPDERGEE